MSFGDEKTARRMIDFIRRIARQEIDAVRPSASYAKVVAFNPPEDRSCQVIFPGGQERTKENEPSPDEVRVVFTNAIPSQVGQIVRIGGTPGDRYIEAVIGQDKAEIRIGAQEELATSRTPALVAASTLSDYGVGNSVTRVQFNSLTVPPISNAISYDTAQGIATVNESGYYKINATVGFENTSADVHYNDERTLWLAHVKPGQAQADLHKDYYTGSAGGNLRVSALDWFPAGTQFMCYHQSRRNRTVWALHSSFTIELVTRAASKVVLS